jgi:hypothetical protein
VALAAVKLTVGQTFDGGGNSSVTIKGGAVPNIAAVVTDTATLVADGASPTQGHVTTLNTDVAALNAALAGDVVLIWDGAVVTHRNQMRVALRHALRAIEAGYGGLAE